MKSDAVAGQKPKQNVRHTTDLLVITGAAGNLGSLIHLLSIDDFLKRYYLTYLSGFLITKNKLTPEDSASTATSFESQPEGTNFSKSCFER